MAGESSSPAGRGRGRSRGSHKPRGGFGKYQRARGYRGRGRPAEFGKRLVLQGEEEVELEEEEQRERREIVDASQKRSEFYVES